MKANVVMNGLREGGAVVVPRVISISCVRFGIGMISDSFNIEVVVVG